MPLGGDPRKAGGEVVRARDLSIRAIGTTGTVRPVVRRRAPNVIRTARAPPPNRAPRSGTQGLGRQDAVALRMPLLDQFGIPRDPVTGSRALRAHRGCALATHMP
jgi:hypothetical protein